MPNHRRTQSTSSLGLSPTSLHFIETAANSGMVSIKCREATNSIGSSLLLGAAADQQLWWQNTDVWVFVAGIIPFAWATVEFWRRIAVGEPFGTGKDSVYIGKDNAPQESRGRRTLDRGAFFVAYLLFALAAGAIGITLYSVLDAPSVDFATASTTSVVQQ